MKMKYLQLCGLALAASAAALLSGCVIEPNGRVVLAPPVVVAPAPVVVAPAPPPPVVVAPAPVVMVPDGYVWDGYEYVGYVGDTCLYLGPGNVWFVCEPWRVERFHGWERGHPDWRVRLVIRNDNYRRDRFGHEQPRREEHPQGRPQPEHERHHDEH
jgi:hypothetical protein